jgi:histidinol-phosphate aminotransferase
LGIPQGEIIKLDANENPYGPLPQVLEALSKLGYAHIYPDPESRVLRAALAEVHKIPAENLLVGAGADELIDLVIRLFLDPDDAFINCPPTFGMYSFDGAVHHAREITIPRRDDFSLDLEAIRTAIEQERPKLIFLTHPNNPDGGLIPPKTLQAVMELPVMVVVDEAYIEFAPPTHSLLSQVTQRENLMVLRTFSKWAGLAGLRIGYGAFPEVVYHHLMKIKQPYNVSVAASTAAMVSLQNQDLLHEIGERIIEERERLFQLLDRIEWLHPYPSSTNFILCRVVGRDAGEIKRALAERGVLVRYFNTPGLADHIRISVGKPEHTDKLIKSLKEMV